MVNSNGSPNIPTALTQSPGFLLNQATRSLKQMMTQALRPVGLAPQEYGMLKVLSLEGPMSQQTLANKYQVDRATITEVVDALEARELVTRQVSQTDRRCKLLHLTPTGNRLMTRASKSVSRVHHKFLAPLTEAEWSTVQQCLLRLIVAAQTDDEPV